MSLVCDVLRPLASKVVPTKTEFDNAVDSNAWGIDDYREFITLRRSTLECHHGKHLVFTGSVTKGASQLVFDQENKATPADTLDRVPMIYIATGVQREADKVSAHLAWKLLKIEPPVFVMEGSLEKGWALMLDHYQKIRQMASDAGLEERRKSHNRTLNDSGKPPMSLAEFGVFEAEWNQASLALLEQLSPGEQKPMWEASIRSLPQERNPIKNAADSLWDQVDQLLDCLEGLHPSEELRMVVWKAYEVGRQAAQFENLRDQGLIHRIEIGLKFEMRVRAKSEHGKIIEKCWNELFEKEKRMPKPKMVLAELIRRNVAQLVRVPNSRARKIQIETFPSGKTGKATYRKMSKAAFNRCCDRLRKRNKT